MPGVLESPLGEAGKKRLKKAEVVKEHVVVVVVDVVIVSSSIIVVVVVVVVRVIVVVVLSSSVYIWTYPYTCMYIVHHVYDILLRMYLCILRMCIRHICS